MDGTFYRPNPGKRWLHNAARTLLSNRRRTLSIMAGIVLGAFVLFNNKGVLARIGYELDRKEMLRKLEEAERENLRLQAQIRALEGDPKTIESIARERYGMAREGETVYRIRKD